MFKKREKDRSIYEETVSRCKFLQFKLIRPILFYFNLFIITRIHSFPSKPCFFHLFVVRTKIGHWSLGILVIIGTMTFVLHFLEQIQRADWGGTKKIDYPTTFKNLSPKCEKIGLGTLKFNRRYTWVILIYRPITSYINSFTAIKVNATVIFSTIVYLLWKLYVVSRKYYLGLKYPKFHI